jgi:hypothetical protein
VGEIGRLLASAEMLKRGIGVSRTELDCGVDLISHYGRVTKLIQVKTKSCETYGTTKNTETFKTYRRTQTYEGCYLDAFVFVSLVTDSFYVVPCSGIDLSKTSVSVRRDSEWKDAWHLLKVGERHA